MFGGGGGDGGGGVWWWCLILHLVVVAADFRRKTADCVRPVVFIVSVCLCSFVLLFLF